MYTQVFVLTGTHDSGVFNMIMFSAGKVNSSLIFIYCILNTELFFSFRDTYVTQCLRYNDSVTREITLTDINDN